MATCLEASVKMIDLLELYSSGGVHKKFLSALYKIFSAHKNVKIITDKIICPDSISMSGQFQLISAPTNRYLRELYYAVYFLLYLTIRKRGTITIVTGSSLLTHVIAGVLPISRISIIIHSEFARAYLNDGKAAFLYRFILKLYKLKRSKLIFLSEYTRNNIVNDGLYNREHTSVITHPLCEPRATVGVRIPIFIVHGLIRRQKLDQIGLMIRAIKDIRPDAKFYMFGKMSSGFDYQELDQFDEIKLFAERYEDDDLLRFLEEKEINTILFTPSIVYRYVVTGTLCDAIEMGLYVLTSTHRALALELCGDLNVSDRNLDYQGTDDLSHVIFDERHKLNQKQIEEIIKSLE